MASVGDPATGARQSDLSARIAVVVLTWNGREDTLACLASLENLRWPQRRVIVVDNSSVDGTVEAVATQYPQVEVVEAPHNLGFGGGNNLGIERALGWGADWVFVLNNDTTVAPDVVEQLMRASRVPGVGVLAPLIMFPLPGQRVWYAGARFDPRRGHSGTMLHYREPVPTGLTGARPTDRAAGAAMMVSRKAIERTGVFDESIFYLYEDVDWSLRLRAAGFTILFVPEARVWHAVAGSQAHRERTPLTSYYGIRNNLTVCNRHAPYGGMAEARRELVCFATHAWGLRRVDDRIGNLRGLLRGWRDFRRGRLGAAPLSVTG